LEVDKPRKHLEKKDNIDYIPDGIYTEALCVDGYTLIDNKNVSTRTLQANGFPKFSEIEDVYMLPVAIDENNLNELKGVVKLGECKITDVYRQGRKFFIYLTDIDGAFTPAKSLVSKKDVTIDETGKITAITGSPTFINLYVEDDCAKLYGAEVPKIIQTGYTMVTPDSDSDNTENYFDGSLEYSIIDTFVFTAISPNMIVYSSESMLEFDNTNGGIIYIYNATTGEHIDVTDLKTNPQSSSINQIKITHENNYNIFTKDDKYVVCGRVIKKRGKTRKKTVETSIRSVTLNENGIILKTAT
jgi:hypothetical protein